MLSYNMQNEIIRHNKGVVSAVISHNNIKESLNILQEKLS